MDLKMEDLMLDCQVCEGTGEIRNPALDRDQGGGSMGSRIVWPAKIDCVECSGKGIILTESGKTLLAFIQRAKQKMLIH